MADDDRAAREWNRALERLAADVTDAAYAVALRHGTGGTWVDLELGLWEALARTIWEWGRKSAGPRIKRFHAIRGGDDRLQTGAIGQQAKA
jgi:hypothetical protein